jgi:hypothetical protein
MHITERITGKKLDVTVELVLKSDYGNITKAKFFFNWATEKQFIVFKLRIVQNKDILALVSINNIPAEKRMEIRLLAVSKVNRGKTKRYERITGTMIGYVCREAVKRYGSDACVSLIPKTELKRHYILAYGMKDAGWQIFLEGMPLLKMINEFI